MSRRSRTPKYVVAFTLANRSRGITPLEWNCRRDGKPTRENLAKFTDGYQRSFQPGGCNEHCGPIVIDYAVVRENRRDGKVLARYRVDEFSDS